MNFTPSDRRILEQLHGEVLRSSERVKNALAAIERIEAKIDRFEFELDQHRREDALPLRARIYKLENDGGNFKVNFEA